MTNRDAWQKYTSTLSSPQNYIDWCYRYLIGACLQRRVWIGSDDQMCFANSYVCLVGPPGIGKGLPIRAVSSMLNYWKLKDAPKLDGETMTMDQKQSVQYIHDDEVKTANEAEMQCKNNKNTPIEPTLFPIAADATTYEALVEAVATSFRRINYVKFDEKQQKNILGIYGHSSLCFSLQELSSLLRKRTDDIVNYLLGLYDCPVDYVYNTKTKGKDRVRRGCLNLLAGTTPGFMQSIFNDALINEGFSSRMFFIYAEKNRGTHFFIPPLTQEQKDCKERLLKHIRLLASLYGQVTISKETHSFLEEWFSDYCSTSDKRANRSAKLVPYYARKNIHVMKVALQEHFSESLSLEVPLERFQEAIAILADEEKNMDKAITMEETNELSTFARKLLAILATGEKDFVELHCDTFSIGTKSQLTETIEFLEETKQITHRQDVDKDTMKQNIKYYIP